MTEDEGTTPRPSLCHGRRILPFGYHCEWLPCPWLWDDEPCPLRLADDDPNPEDASDIYPHGVAP